MPVASSPAPLPAIFDSLALPSLDDKDKPVETRLQTVTQALSIYSALAQADETSAQNRARMDSLFDGAAPYDQARLNAAGLSQKTNLNFGEAKRLLDTQLSAFVDLYSSLEELVEVKGTIGEGSQRGELEKIVAQEATRFLRDNPDFHGNYLRLATTFIKHGVGIAYFDTPEDVMFQVSGFSDLLVPRQTRAIESSLEVAVGRRELTVSELYRFVANPTVAKKAGWDVAEAHRVIRNNVQTTGRGSGSVNPLGSTAEDLQNEFKNADLHMGVRNPAVSVLYFWVREMDGTVSQFIMAEHSPKEFLYKKAHRFESMEQAFIFFCWGVGSNGTLHSVRGLGQQIFPHVQVSNRLRSQAVDSAMLSSAVMLQPESERALQELSMTYYAGFSILSPNINIVDKVIPNVSTAVMPILNDLTQQLYLNSDPTSTYTTGQSSPYKSQMQVATDMDILTRLSGATLNLFYASWTRLLREVIRRMATTKNRDKRLKKFFEKCAARGVPEKFIATLDFDRTSAVKAIGNGSAANRLVALREMQAISGQFDDAGRRNLTQDIVATRVGFDLAARYVPPAEGPRPTLDTKIAMLENDALQQGKPIPVLDTELHGTHLMAHVPLMEQLNQAIDEGQADALQALPMIQALYQHIAEHMQYASGDPALVTMLNRAKQVLQRSEEHAHNAMKAQQKLERDALAAEQAEQQPGGVGAPEGASEAAPSASPSDGELKMMRAQADMDIQKAKAELSLQITQRKFEQEQSIADAKAAADFRREFSKERRVAVEANSLAPNAETEL